MVNLGEETRIVLGKKINDIAWIGCTNFSIPIDEFWKIADATDYDCGYGAQEIAMDLMIVMNDGTWYSRHEYDGSESWSLHSIPKKPADEVHIEHLKVHGKTSCGWETLGSLNFSIYD